VPVLPVSHPFIIAAASFCSSLAASNGRCTPHPPYPGPRACKSSNRRVRCSAYQQQRECVFLSRGRCAYDTRSMAVGAHARRHDISQHRTWRRLPKKTLPCKPAMRFSSREACFTRRMCCPRTQEGWRTDNLKSSRISQRCLPRTN
jgi:hypothetical protein